MILSSWFDGLRRVRASPATFFGVFALTTLLALPLVIAVRDELRTQLGRSLVANDVAAGANWDWWQEFSSQAGALASTFTPSVIGFAATLENISSLLDGEGQVGSITGALAAYLLGWAFISGGIIDRYARQRPTRAHGFFAASGGFLFRFLRLGVLMACVYGLLFIYVHAALFDHGLEALTRRLSVERTALVLRILAYFLFGSLLISVNVVFDYARIRAVVEDRRSMLGAVKAAIGFIRRNPVRTFGLYAINGGLFLLLLAIWSAVAPGVTDAGASMWLAFLAGQLYVAGRLVLKLQFLASQTALFQRSLAHASYTAAPAVIWPDSPAAEAAG